MSKYIDWYDDDDGPDLGDESWDEWLENNPPDGWDDNDPDAYKEDP